MVKITDGLNQTKKAQRRFAMCSTIGAGGIYSGIDRSSICATYFIFESIEFL